MKGQALSSQPSASFPLHREEGFPGNRKEDREGIMNRGPGVVRTVLIVLGSSWFALLLNILRVLVLPGKLGDAGIGQVTLALSFTTFFGIFTSLGTTTYLIRAVARDRQVASNFIGNAVLLRVVMGVLVLGIIMGIASALPYTPQAREVIFIVGISMVIFTVSNAFEAGLQGLGQQSWRAISTAVGQSTGTLTGIAALLMGADARTYALSIPLGMLIQFMLVLSYYILHQPISLRPTPPVMKALLVGGLPLFIWGFLQTAYGQIDATILSLFASEHVVGWFGAASQITNVLIVIAGAITTVALPLLCEMYAGPAEQFDRAAARTMTCTLLVLAPVGAGLAVSAWDVLRILPYPPVFLNAAPALALLALAVPVTGALMVLSTLAVAIGQERQWVKISAFAVCIFPPLYVSMIWLCQHIWGNGAVGAALANLIGESALVLWAWVVLPARLRNMQITRSALRIAAVCVAMVAVVALMQRAGLPLLAYVPAGAATYIAGVWLAGVLRPDDLLVVRNALLRRHKARSHASAAG